MPRHYRADLRRQVCERLLAGEAIKDLTAERASAARRSQVAATGADRRRRDDPGPESYETDPFSPQARVVKLEDELEDQSSE